MIAVEQRKILHQLFVRHKLVILQQTSITLAVVICDADESCSVKKNCIGSRVVFHNVTSEYDSTFILLHFRFQLRILSGHTCPSVLQSGLSFCHAGIVSSFFHSLSTAAFTSGIFITYGIGISSCTKPKCDIEIKPLPAM